MGKNIMSDYNENMRKLLGKEGVERGLHFLTPKNPRPLFSLAEGSSNYISSGPSNDSTTEIDFDKIKEAFKRLREMDPFYALAKSQGIDNPDDHVLLIHPSMAEKYGLSDHPRIKVNEYVEQMMFINTKFFGFNY